MKIKIETVPDSYTNDEGFEYCISRITINNYSEGNTTALGYWSIDDYEKQWKEGLERIKTHDNSCLVTSVQDPTKRPLITWWVLYKEGNKIFIQNEMFIGEVYKQYIGDKIFSPETCYNFIQPRETEPDEDGDKPLEWVVDLNEDQ